MDVNHFDPAPRILLVEDDELLRTFLADNLTADGFDVLLADGVRDALRLLEYKSPDVCVVDLALPDGSGLDVLRAVRGSDGVSSRIDPELPLLVLSGRAGENDRIRALERGGDDFVAKPFSYTELLLRLRALLRRASRLAGGGVVRVGELTIDPVSRQVSVAGARVELSAKEYDLLRALASEPSRVFTKEELLRSVWGFRALGTTRTLDSHACRLRSKLSASGERFVVNVWGVGYRLIDAAAPARAA